MASTQLCTFSVDDIKFGVDVLHVQEVLRHQEITEVPLAPEAVTGLINLRGQIVTAIEMRKRLGSSGRQAEEVPMNVVLRTSESVVSLLVDSIGDVVEVDEDQLENPPETMDPHTRRLVKAVCKLDEGLLLVLDAQAATGQLAE